MSCLATDTTESQDEAIQVGRLVREWAGAELRRLTGKARSGGRSELLAEGRGFDSLHVAGSRLGLVHAL